MPQVGLYTGAVGSAAFTATHHLASVLILADIPVVWVCAAHPRLPCGHYQETLTPAGYRLRVHGTGAYEDETAQAAFDWMTTHLDCQILHALLPMAEAFLPAFVAAWQKWPLLLTPWNWQPKEAPTLTEQWILAQTTDLIADGVPTAPPYSIDMVRLQSIYRRYSL